jgi:cathepsin L
MKQFVFLLVLVALVFGSPDYATEFVNWMQKHQKSYTHTEFLNRYEIFKSNYDFVQEHNTNSEHGFTVAINKFADLSNTEFKKIYNGFNMDFQQASEFGETFINDVDPSTIPSSYDWRKEGVVTGVKNQGQCGSCWSFSTTGSVEACHKLSGNSLVALSEQNLMDCSWSEGDQGCNGGLMTNAMDYIIKNGGVDTENSYPYEMKSSHSCRYQSSNKGSTLGSYQNIPQGSESGLLAANSKGPVSVAIDAGESSFQFYNGGVYYSPSCSSTQLDHGVLAAGWGSYSGKDYWLVKNSWGADWGLNGYIMMSRNRNNNCGIATSASLPKAGTCGN